MNYTRLKEAEERFIMAYPGGFSHPDMLALAKKHKVEKMKQLAQESFGIDGFSNAPVIVEAMAKVVAQSTLISLFEKPKFRDVVQSLNQQEKEHLADGLREFLHGDQAAGFAGMTGLLAEYKIAKWPILTVWSIYYNPNTEVFVKPTTVKGIIAHFEWKGIHYSPNPTFEFYRDFRAGIMEMKAKVHPSLQVDNAAFCGFLMTAIDGKMV